MKSSTNITESSNRLLQGIETLIEHTGRQVAVYLNSTISCLYWSIGNYILIELQYEMYSRQGQQILATLSQTLTKKFGKGYTYSGINRMIKVANAYRDGEKFATLSRTLSWSHFIELVSIEDSTKRLFYQQMSVVENWSIRTLRQKQDSMLFERTLIAAKPEDEIIKTLQTTTKTNISPDLVFKNSYILDFFGLTGYYSEKDLEDAILHNLEQFIMELGQDFAFVERQKRIPIDSVDYSLDLLFFHRKLNRLVAIDLKLGKFQPQYKGQMELYLKYLQKHDKQPHEENPIGLLLCSEGNTEHIEYLMLDEKNIKVAQYLTVLPDKQWFIDKLNRSIAIAQENVKTSNRENNLAEIEK
ncbi:MAG: PDDEXK nuclease domain-containing protein [Lentimicrobiaceae bacterium]|jgi:predicted nuclease of restriction endonuclease-like (RecB) superfamily|nr:PDDEXK nuclease domain-containing protein [Lentimicrobiaceae bacterium]